MNANFFRTLIRIDDISPHRICIVIPAWNPYDIVYMGYNDFPNNIEERILKGQKRFHAEVNLGAESSNDLIFINWEEQ